MADELRDTIDEVASGPKSASNESTRVDQQSIPDLIAWHRYRAGLDAQTSRRPLIRFGKPKLPGANAE